MKVHPPADIFPMVPDDGLATLAESIKANGLRYPIVVRKVSNGNGVVEDEVIDGRNRLRATRGTAELCQHRG
jgi:ParB-like chromosome segregation protein Spo0J